MNSWCRKLASAAVITGLATSLTAAAIVADSLPTSAASGVATAKKLTAHYQLPPTSIGVTKKIGKPIPKGKIIAYMSTGLPSSTVNLAPLQAAAKLLGWKIDEINIGTSATTIQQGFNEVVSLHPDAIINIGTATSEFSSQCAQLARADIPVFDSSVLTTQGEGYGGCVKGFTDAENQISVTGRIMADYIVANSNGKAHVLQIGGQDFGILTAVTSGLTKELKRLCPSCTSNIITVQATDIGKTVATKVVGYLRAHPTTNYVAASFDTLFLGVPAALQSAGLTKVTLVGMDPSSANAVAISSGSLEKASVAFGIYEQNYRAMDQIARYFTKGNVKIDQFAPDPFFTLANTNVSHWPGSPSAYPWPNVKNYQAQYKKLWGLG